MIAHTGPFGVFGALVSAVERTLGAKVRLRAEQDLLPIYTAVCGAEVCGHRHQSQRAAERCAAARSRRGGAWVVQASPRGPRLRWSVSSQGGG